MNITPYTKAVIQVTIPIISMSTLTILALTGFIPLTIINITALILIKMALTFPLKQGIEYLIAYKRFKQLCNDSITSTQSVT